MTSTDVTLATWDNITGINGTGITTNADSVEYDPPFTGALTSGYSVEDKLAQYVSVADFGAVPNDSTKKTVNMTAFRDAMKALKAAGGGELFIPAGEYHLSVAQPIFVPSNVTIRGIRGASVIVPDVSTLPVVSPNPGFTSTGVFVTGDPDTDTRSGLSSGPQVAPHVGKVYSNDIVTNVHFKDISIRCDYTGPKLTTNTLRGIAMYFAYDSSVTGCYAYNLPNDGIGALGGARNIYSSNTVEECGWTGLEPSTRNGFSFSGWMDQTDAAYTSQNIVITDNIFANNYDEGIAFAMTAGMVISNNVCIGNRDRGIEGISTYAQTITESTYGQVIPGDVLIVNNYVDGAGTHQSESRHGITASDSNQRKIIVANNIVKNVGADVGTGIGVNQSSGGVAEIDNNILVNIKPQTNYHAIFVSTERAYVTNNRIVSSAAVGTNCAGISANYTTNTVVADNLIESGFVNTIAVSCSAAGSATYTPTSVVVQNNTVEGSTLNGITVVFLYDTTLTLLKVTGNNCTNINSNGSTDRGCVDIRGTSGKTLSIGTAVINGNTATYAGTTRYPIMSTSVPVGAIADMYVTENFFGSPQMPFGKRVVISENIATNLYQDANRIPGNRVLYGTAAPTSGTYGVGDITYAVTPAAGGFIGWVCTAAGTPGTWKTFGAISV